MSDPLLVQYQVLTNQRIHFGKLYWQSIAFLFALLLSSAAIIDDPNMLNAPAALVPGGAVIILMAFVAERLRRLEAHYERLLTAIEDALRDNGNDQVQQSPKSGAFGARVLITLLLFLLGLLALGKASIALL